MNFCFTEREKEKKLFPKELEILLIFQNIAYTSSKNYQKWFYNKYFITKDKTYKRERSYSLDSEIDFDECLTNRKIDKISSLETIYESFIDDYIEDYYSPIPSEFICYFEKNLDFFPKKIESIPINFFGISKLKYFTYQNQIFISLMFPKNIVLSNEKIKIDKFYYSKTLIDFSKIFQENSNLQDFIINLNNYDEIYFVSHYKNTIFTDYIISKLTDGLKITYLSISPEYFNDDKFYQKLDSKIKFYVFSNNYLNVKNFNKIENLLVFCCGERINYRKNLKNNTIQILKLLN